MAHIAWTTEQKMEAIFAWADRDEDRILSCREADILQFETEGVHFDDGTWMQMCSLLGADPHIGCTWEHIQELYEKGLGDLAKDFRIVLKRMEETWTKEEKMDTIFEWADKDNDGVLNFQECATLQSATEDSEMTVDLFECMCKLVGANPSVGLQKGHYHTLYLSTMSDAHKDFDMLMKREVEFLDVASKCCRARRGPLPMHVPSYWANKDLSIEFRDKCEVPEQTFLQIQSLLDETFKSVRTRDRSGSIPLRLQLCHCYRVEDSCMWGRYLRAQDRVRARRPDGIRSVNELYGDSQQGEVKTLVHLKEDFSERLDASINEYYLWHGTTPEGATGISADGFRVRLAGSHAGTMFGNGCYFAECSSKSDEYSMEGDGELTGLYSLLLCRVTCGEFVRVTRSDTEAIQAALFAGTADAVLGDREASVGTYREIVVFQEDVIYPEYIILYRRELASSVDS
eukprot:TRINITY_DN41019_c0_g1_i1.p1 TRINITY_DN41019_c0_g1~~TRINITY_DN41019_c0_g1_i1.p1  ORF type:complete len:457 (-),score=48.50 TRINITY_DN41019_c0_g1_i1:56-1426(-)